MNHIDVHLPPLVSSPDDSMCVSPQRVKGLENSFIEVYVGTEVFDNANLNSIVAIYLQATARLYEVVVINKDTTEEIRHFYVFEDELRSQMKSRLSALTLAKDTHAAWAVARVANIKSKPHTLPVDMSYSTLISSPMITKKPLRRKSAGDEELTTQLPEHTRSRRKSLVPVFGPRQFSDLTPPSSISPGRRSSIAELHHDLFGHNEVRPILSRDKVRAATLLKEVELADFLVSGRSTLTAKPVPVSDPVAYFSLMAGHVLGPAVGTRKKIKRAELLEDYSLLESDISTSSMQDIMCFTTVILSSLYVRQQARKGEDSKLQLVLFDGNIIQSIKDLHFMLFKSGYLTLSFL